ncbi:23S rRNA (adenine(2503)-C(2))-methyltransferase RlmN [Candidatus Bipolaricaulota bacterium]
MPDPSLLDLSYDALADRLTDLPVYRIDQIWQGVYRELAGSYETITTLPRSLRARLAESIPFTVLDPIDEQVSRDGLTWKTLSRLADEETIESVTMKFPDRRTTCVSSQVGCAVGCPFCATGNAGFIRNLTAGEIVAQVLQSARHLRARGKSLSHVVYMGMGEPFLNYGATLGSIRILNDQRGFSLGARSFTISTAGIVPGIDRLAEEGLQVNLAVSLHAADDRTRDRLVPVNVRYPLETLLAACRRYTERSHRRITFEVALLEGVNDTDRHARNVADRLAGLLCHVNLITHNPTPNAQFCASSADRIRAFADILTGSHIPVTVRHSRGSDIQAGCGQLRSQRETGADDRTDDSPTRSADRDNRTGLARPSFP